MNVGVWFLLIAWPEVKASPSPSLPLWFWRQRMRRKRRRWRQEKGAKWKSVSVDAATAAATSICWQLPTCLMHVRLSADSGQLKSRISTHLIPMKWNGPKWTFIYSIYIRWLPPRELRMHTASNQRSVDVPWYWSIWYVDWLLVLISITRSASYPLQPHQQHDNNQRTVGVLDFTHLPTADIYKRADVV